MARAARRDRGSLPEEGVIQAMFDGINTFALLALPFFFLAATF